MIGQYLPNNNETVTVAFHQKNYQLNIPLAGGVTRLLVLVAGQRVTVCTSPKLYVATGHVGSKAEATTHE
jgi:hypothetical protein